MSVYYNEIDPFAAAWLAELMKAGAIPDGEIDTRSIEDVNPTDLAGFVQCHFFAGIGVWAYSLRLAGIPEDYSVWTGSCPCQPFSAAGKGKGFADERHLWPAFHHLISVCRPERVFGEQVASKDGLGWLDLVSTDLEALGYACGAVPFPAAGIGAPHIRQRLYWVADADDAGSQGRGIGGHGADQCASGPGGLAGGVADDGSKRRERREGATNGGQHDWPYARRLQGHDGSFGYGEAGDGHRPGPTHGFWRDADWLGCRDGKWRPVEPGTFPLAHGAANRVGRLRGYGNAIVAQQAAAFITAWGEVRGWL